MDTILIDGSAMPVKMIACHYLLRCSYQLHGSVMANKSFLTFFEFARFFSKDLYRYIHNAMCEYVCFCLSRPFFMGRNRIHHTSPQK